MPIHPTRTDSRIGPVEDNLLAFFRLISRSAIFEHEDADDVLAFHSGHDYPLFNVIVDARFAPGAEARRTHELLDAYVARGRPFLWWTTPSTTSPEVEAVLVERGLACSDTPGMYATLAAPRPRRGDASIEVVDSSDTGFLDVTIDAFGMPELVRVPFRKVAAGWDPDTVATVLARDGATVLGGGTLVVDGLTAGIYNVATLERHRGRGVGHDVTAALMDLGRERGCTHAVLHASDIGLPVYQRLGFETVCRVPQYVWLPPSTEAETRPPRASAKLQVRDRTQAALRMRGLG